MFSHARLGLASVGVLMLVAAASAQTALGTLRGVVLDQQAAALPGVTITVRETQTNTTQTIVTGTVGQYFLPNLRPGNYEMTAELAGFAPSKQTLILRVGQELTVNFTLRLAGVAETVEVVGSVIVETTSTVATVISNKQIDALPTIGGDFTNLATLAPGATDSQTTGTGQGTGLSVSGQRPFANGIVVDGASNLMQFYGRQGNDYPQDWIQEFQVLSNSFSAEYGQAAGGVLNVITRSGSNTTSGRGYGFFHNSSFDAAPFAGKYDANHNPIFLTSPPQLTVQRYGGFLGGPVLKNKVFYFGAIQRLQQTKSDVLGISDYWRQYITPTIIPMEDRFVDGEAKVDWNAGEKHRFYFRYTNSYKRWHNMAGTTPDVAGPLFPEETRSDFGGPLWNILGNWTMTVSNTAFNELRVNYGVNNPWILTYASGGYGGAALLAACGYNLTNGGTGKCSDWRYPGANLGNTSFSGLEGEENLFIADNFSLVRGQHQFKLGGVLARQKMNMDVEASEQGHWSFILDAKFNINDPSSYPSSFTGELGSGEAYPVAWSPSFFIQDTWQARSNLTLNYGLRWDLDGSLTAANPWVDPYNQRIVARLSGSPVFQKSKADYNNFAPRVGLVWQPTNDRKTTLRGSFGMYYDQNHWNVTDVYINETLLALRKVSINCQSSATNPYWTPSNTATGIATCRSYLAQNFPAYPDLSKLPYPVETASYIDPNWQVPYSANFSVGFTHDFSNAMSVRADYMRTRSYDVSAGWDTNWIQNPDGTWVRKDPRYASMGVNNNAGGIWYNGLVTRFEYRPSAKGSLGISYTLSKTMSNTSSGLTTGGNTIPFNVGYDYGPDSNDRRHNLVVDAGYLVPKIDVQAAGIMSYRSALPWTVTTSVTTATLPYIPRPEPRNSRRGDSEEGVDLRLSKIVHLGGRVSATVFWEMFNAFNFDNYTSFQGSLQSSVFGYPISELPKRRQQLGFRFDF